MANEKGPNIKKKQKCKNCEGKGLLKKGDKVVKCQRCGGTGFALSARAAADVSAACALPYSVEIVLADAGLLHQGDTPRASALAALAFQTLSAASSPFRQPAALCPRNCLPSRLPRFFLTPMMFGPFSLRRPS